MSSRNMSGMPVTITLGVTDEVTVLPAYASVLIGAHQIVLSSDPKERARQAEELFWAAEALKIRFSTPASDYDPEVRS